MTIKVTITHSDSGSRAIKARLRDPAVQGYNPAWTEIHPGESMDFGVSGTLAIEVVRGDIVPTLPPALSDPPVKARAAKKAKA